MEKDFVCGMYLVKVKEELKSTYKGVTFYFCCKCCKAEFDKNPEKYFRKKDKVRKTISL